MEPLDTLLNELQESLEIPSQASLYHLSDLDNRDLVRVRRAWRRLPTELRQEMIARLVELAEADFEVNFGALFRLGLPPYTYGAGLNLFSNKMIGFFMHNLGAYKVDRRKKACGRMKTCV